MRDEVEAADREVAAARAPGIVVGEADAGNKVDDFVDRLAGTLTLDQFGIDNDLRLRRFGDDDARDIARDRAGNDDFTVEIRRTGRLGKGGSGKQRDRNQRAAGGKRVTEFHFRMSPWWCVRRRATMGALDLRAPLTPACGTIVTAIVTVQPARRRPVRKKPENREFCVRGRGLSTSPASFFSATVAAMQHKKRPAGRPLATQAASPAASFALSA